MPSRPPPAHKERLSFNLVLGFSSASAWARLRGASRAWRERLGPGSGALEFMAFSLGLPSEPKSDLLSRLIAVERLASPRFTPPPPTDVLETLEGGGIWCLELHKRSNLVFAGCWGPAHQVDLIKAWDATSGAFVGSLYGHFSDVKCLCESGPLLWSGSYDGSMRCWDVATMAAAPTPAALVVATGPVLALVATPARLFSAHDDGAVRCWDAATGEHLWSSAHPGPVTALALRGDRHLVTASTCPCFNGSGFSLRLVERADGRYVRRLGDEDWSPRKTVTFMLPLGAAQQSLLVGFGAPLATVATGAVAVEHEVAQVLPFNSHRATAAHLARLRRRSASQRWQHASAAASSGFFFGAGRGEELADDGGGVRSLNAAAWGVECVAAHGGNVATGTDNGLVVVTDASGSHRHRVLDVCSLAGFRPSSRKVTALCLAGTKVLVALQAFAGDRDSEGFRGKLLCFDLVEGSVKAAPPFA